MSYAKCKVYNDGSHYIAIPHEKQPWKRKKVVVNQEETEQETKTKEIYKTVMKKIKKKS